MEFQVTWFVLWAVLWAVYFMLDGFVLGTGMLHHFLTRNDQEKKILIRTVGPVWDGNEVWLVTAGGATFAAFPTTYALMFSYLYSALLLLLFSLIIRGVSLEFRGKIENDRWKKAWDMGIFIGSALPALLLGVAFGNIFSGLPMDAAGYHGSLLSLLNPYGLLTGALFVLMFLTHGSLYVSVKTEGELCDRSTALAGKLWFAELAVAVLFLVATAYFHEIVRQLPEHPAAADRSRPGGGGPARHQGLPCERPSSDGVRVLLPDHRHGRIHRRDRALSEPDPVQHRPGIQPHDLQFLFQYIHLEDHDDRGPCVRSHCDRLQNMGVPHIQVAHNRQSST